MTNQEFSNQFDILFNNITSNQAPGLDEYEKSVFLTMAQDDIIRAYFNPKSNKLGEGFDGSEKRQIDFSSLMCTRTLNIVDDNVINEGDVLRKNAILDNHSNSVSIQISSIVAPPHSYIDAMKTELYKKNEDGSYSPYTLITGDLVSNRDNIKPILFVVNEFLDVSRNDNTIRCSVLPIDFNTYAKNIAKPNKRPSQYQAWRLIVDEDICWDLVPPLSSDKVTKYIIRYVSKPTPIILTDLDDNLTINGKNKKTSCSLDSILHMEILQRAVELAKAAYIGDITSTLTINGQSGTDKGYVASQQQSKQ